MHLHSPVVLSGWLLYPSELSDSMLPACMVLTAHSQLSPLGLGLVLLHRGRLVPAAGAVRRHHAACVVSRRGFGLRLEAQLIQACFDKVKRVCCEKHLHSKL